MRARKSFANVRSSARTRTSDDHAGDPALRPGREAALVVADHDVEVEHADLTALDGSARDIAHEDHVAAAAETEGQRRPIVLIIL